MTTDARKVAEDWITIWQSELTATAFDRELVEGFSLLVDHWARAARLAAAFLPGAPDGSAGRAGAGAAAGSAAAHAAPDARGPASQAGAIRGLAERVAELERIIAGLRQPKP